MDKRLYAHYLIFKINETAEPFGYHSENPTTGQFEKAKKSLDTRLSEGMAGINTPSYIDPESLIGFLKMVDGSIRRK
jgi:hypothetical protein